MCSLALGAAGVFKKEREIQGAQVSEKSETRWYKNGWHLHALAACVRIFTNINKKVKEESINFQGISLRSL